MLVDGLAGDRDADASRLTVVDPDVHGGSRAARRLLRARDEIDLAIVPATRIVTEDADGVRERIDADTLFADLDESLDDVNVEATALVGRRAGRRGRAVLTVTARRIVVHLPADVEVDPADDPVDDPSPEDGDPLPDDQAQSPFQNDAAPACPLQITANPSSSVEAMPQGHRTLPASSARRIFAAGRPRFILKRAPRAAGGSPSRGPRRARRAVTPPAPRS